MLLGVAGIPAKEFGTLGVAYRSVGEFAANGINEPWAVACCAIVCAEFGPEPEAVLSRGHSCGIVWRAADGHVIVAATPCLIRKPRFVKTDGIVEIGEKAAGIRYEINCRALMRDDAMAVNGKFVLPGFSSEDGMVFEDQAF